MKELFELVYLVYEGKLTTQREFSESMFISLGKVNSLIKKARHEAYIIGDKTYSITSKGMELLEAHRVDNAVIMAAGLGTRFVPMTFDKPKGLQEVFGEVMIERQIKQLHEVGITDISIVVGYLKEKFEYLSDKYNVQLIHNPDYSLKNNISSVYYAQGQMKNTYLLPSDIYMPKNIYRKYEYESFYASEYFEEKTSEWAVNVNKDNLILEANASGGTQTWAMFGPAFFTEKFSNHFVEKINEVYNDNSTKQWFWEDVYIRNISSLDLYIRKYETGTILEFETVEDLRQYDSSYLLHARSEILEIIAKVFDVGLEEIKGIRTLKEGMTNDSFLFEINGEKFVFRNPGLGTEELMNRFNERDVYDVIGPLKISDEVVYLKPECGYKITKFIPDGRNMDINNPKELETALQMIRDLHTSGLIVNHEFNLEERINHYLELMYKSGAVFFTDFDDVHKNIRKVIDRLKKISRPKVLCHVDPVSVNFLYSKGTMHLLDWEYAGMGDPFQDLAMYIVYEGLQDDEIIQFLDQYLQRTHTEEELMILHSYVAMAGFLWSMWTQYKQASGEDFGTYGMEQYRYGRKYARIVLEGEKHA